MTSSLFQEALADAKQLKEVAEQNAKNAIIDAVTPKIRKFIEDQLLEGAARRDVASDLDEEASDEDIDLTTDGSSPVDLAGSPEELAERANLMHVMSRIAESLTPEESAALIPIVEKMRDASLKPGSAGISRAAPSDVRSTHIVKENAAMQGKNKMYEVDLDELMSGEMPHKKEAKHMGKKHAAHDADEMSDYDMEEGMHGMAHDMEEEMDLDMDEESDEMADLYESLAALYEADDDDAGEDDDEDMAPLAAAGEDEETDEDEDAGEDEDSMAGGLPPTDEVPEGMDAIVGAVESAVESAVERAVSGLEQRLLDAMQGAGAGAPSAAAPAEEMGAEMPPAPAAGPAMPPGASPGPSERVYRVNEAALMRELKALREGKKNGNGNGNGNGKPKDEVLDTGIDEGNHDLEEEEEIGEMVDSEGMHTYEGRGAKGKPMPVHTPGRGPGKAVPYTEAAKMKVMKENRDLKVSLAKHAEAINSLRGQLTEMNLFNAKLLYVNRLLQDRDLTDAQRRNIIESLDRAQSLREVKLLYKGLSESIGRKAPAKKSEMVNESVGSRTVSSSSRPLSSSGVRLNEAVEVHRWALLAGIGSKS